jgi:hypothetical protein
MYSRTVARPGAADADVASAPIQMQRTRQVRFVNVVIIGAILPPGFFPSNLFDGAAVGGTLHRGGFDISSPFRRAAAFVVAFIPTATLVGGLPFVNRLEPFVLGLPFLLFWFAAWVLATPVFLGLAYLLLRVPAGAQAGGAGE